MQDRLKKQIDFIRELDKTKNIFRQTYIGDGSRYENDAEHAWHLGVMTMLLSEYADRSVDISRVIKMVLIHDIIEIDAGDTYAYDEEANKTKRERELKAADRIFNMLPEEQAVELRKLWDEFEACETEDAKFANSMDVLHPVMMNDMAGGRAWLEHGVTEEQAQRRIARIRPGSEALYEVAKSLVEKNVELGNIRRTEQ